MARNKSPFHGDAVNMHDYKCKILYTDGSSLVDAKHIGYTAKDAEKKALIAHGCRRGIRSVKCKRA